MQSNVFHTTVSKSIPSVKIQRKVKNGQVPKSQIYPREKSKKKLLTASLNLNVTINQKTTMVYIFSPISPCLKTKSNRIYKSKDCDLNKIYHSQ
jgi:hypothetical protein